MTVITEFDAGDPEATMHTLADEILKYRRAVKLLAKAIGWAETGAPFALINPGPYGPSVCRSMRRKPAGIGPGSFKEAKRPSHFFHWSQEISAMTTGPLISFPL